MFGCLSAIAVEGSARYRKEVFYFLLGLTLKMQNYALWWLVVGVVAFLAILILIMIFAGDHSPPPKTQNKRSRSRTPPTTTSHALKRRPLTVFKRCQERRRKISVTDTHDLCLLRLAGDIPC